ncbi:hypothetical protein [Sphingobium sp. YBL2]|uniref:hypothetical protein n=1 Tax=Sphingobium sp. (strain YBL2) TaxID=484429 RepID=UPI0005CBD55F|nr:hypothetical protein [Sphingobium sp. YBL2]AJR24527.1 hypothetical protein TZ53_13135 [Sphingobium sp. YBL2]
MVDRPILFSAPMVRAIREGRKTQTRRVAKFIEKLDDGCFHARNSGGGALGIAEADVPHIAPDYAPFAEGDRLWVKETWQAGMSDNGPCVAYRADGDRYYPEFTGPSEGAGPTFDYDAHPAKAWRHGYWIADVESSGPWSTPLHMPRWASRLTLTVSEVRVERLQDISEADAIAEGIEARGVGVLWGWIDYLETNPNVTRHFADPRRSYASLWDSINGPGAWEANPWVVAVSFDVLKGNIDG